MTKPQTMNRERPLGRIALILLASAIIYLILLGPQIDRLGQLRKREKELEISFAKMKRDLLAKDRVDRTYRSIEPMIKSTGHHQQEISLFTRELNDLYSPLGVRVRSVKILPANQNEFYRQFSVKLDMSGEIKDILRFLEAVETCAKPIKIEKLTLTAKDVPDQLSASFLISKIVSTPAGSSKREARRL